MYLIVWSDGLVVRVCVWLGRGCELECHFGQLSIWDKKFLAQNEYHKYH